MLESHRKVLKDNGVAFKGDENELNASREALKGDGESFKDDGEVLKCIGVR